MKHALVWGGQFNGKLAHDVEMEPPMSGAILLLDRYRNAPVVFLKELLAASTKSINGVRVDRSDALSFWGTVKYQDAQVAAIALIRENWIDSSGKEPKDIELEQDIKCFAGHLSQVRIGLSQFKTNASVQKDFSISFRAWDAEDDKRISQMRFELETMDQQEKLQEYLADEKYNEMLLRKIAIACTLPEHPDFQLTLAHVMRMPPSIRRMIASEFDSHQLIDLTIKGHCAQCPRPAEGVLNVVDFL